MYFDMKNTLKNNRNHIFMEKIVLNCFLLEGHFPFIFLFSASCILLNHIVLIVFHI